MNESLIECRQVGFTRICPGDTVAKLERYHLSVHDLSKPMNLAALVSERLRECVYGVDREKILGWEPGDVDALQVIVHHEGDYMITAPTRELPGVRINLNPLGAVKLEDGHLTNYRGILIAYTSTDPRGVWVTM